MKRVISVSAILAAALAGGCVGSTPATRIEQRPAVFRAWPEAVQAKVRAGQVEVGFTPDMVRMALGEPDRVRSLVTPQGRSEIWIFFDHGPHFSIGLGVGVSSGHNAYGGGAGVGAGPDGEERLRVIFDGGKVSAIETVKCGRSGSPS